MKNLDNYVNELKRCYKDRLKMVFIYGSNALTDTSELKKDVDLMVIIDDLNAQDLKKCAKESANWVKRGNPVPVFMSTKEWLCSTDVYPMEYADIKDRHRVLYGDNFLITTLNIARADLRLQCEQEAKNLLLRLRKFYITKSHCDCDLKEMFIPAFKSVMALFRTILRLKETEVPDEAQEVISKVSELGIIDKNFYEKLLCYKLKKCKIENPGKTAEELIDSIDRLLRYTNDL